MQLSVALRDSYYANKWHPLHANASEPSQEQCERTAQEDVSQEQAAAARVALLLDEKSTENDKTSSLSSGTPEFVRVFAAHCRTAQLYCARQDTWSAAQNNTTADTVTAADLHVGLIAAF